MISGETTSCFPAAVSSRGPQLYSAVTDDVVSTSLETSSSSLESTHPNSLLYPLSLLKEKVHHLQNLASVFISPDPTRPAESTAMAAATMATVVQEIIVTASSMMFTCQQMTLASHPAQAPVPAPAINNTNCGGGATASTTEMDDQECVEIFRKEQPQDFYSGETLDWFGDEYATSNTNDNNTHKRTINWSSNGPVEVVKKSEENISSESSYDIIELKASDLLAKYTHYCHVCGKGFKRDANLRMHMRAHGDEYKTSAALSNPAKGGAGGGGERKGERIKYSCPEEGCRWNRKHAKFQPLKSMICVKNHYKRSHCPKMYVCKRCNRKQFSVLSDLRTHEKHCGDQRWLCSCGTTFSRKDKLLGHVALFVGHAPAVGSLVKVGKIDRNDHVVQI